MYFGNKIKIIENWHVKIEIVQFAYKNIKIKI